jgi:hypothetical protein
VKPHAKEQPPACILCGTPAKIEKNHVGGRNHIAWFKMPFCKIHHDQFHELLRNTGIDLRYTPNELERLNRANQAIIVCQWMIAEATKRVIAQNPQG